jgi:hypothetical protein
MVVVEVLDFASAEDESCRYVTYLGPDSIVTKVKYVSCPARRRGAVSFLETVSCSAKGALACSKHHDDESRHLRYPFGIRLELYSTTV